MRQISLSTMWSRDKYRHMAEFAEDANDFGFSHIELNYAVTPERLKELLEVKTLSIASVHAPCPMTPPIHPGKGRFLSSLDEEIRRAAIKMVSRTISLAAELKAKAVIIHSGRVEETDIQENKRLKQLFGEGKGQTDEFLTLRHHLTAERKTTSGPHLEATEKSLRELAEFAAARQIKLGLENRLYLLEIPDFDEMVYLLDRLPPDTVGYWHDAGHAEVQSRLGSTPHNEWLKRLGKRMVGAHLHDIRGIDDHYAPGVGDMDWNLIARHLPPQALLTCEIAEWNAIEDTRQAVTFLQNRGILTE